MKLAENAYAIGPSFTDHAYEAWEARAYARDAALESFTQDWRADITTDYRCKVFAKIDNAIEAVLDSIFNNVEKANRFKRLIFSNSRSLYLITLFNRSNNGFFCLIKKDQKIP